MADEAAWAMREFLLQRSRAEAAEAKLDEIRSTITTYFQVHGNSTAASLTKARDLAEGIRQILDREPS